MDLADAAPVGAGDFSLVAADRDGFADFREAAELLSDVAADSGHLAAFQIEVLIVVGQFVEGGGAGGDEFVGVDTGEGGALVVELILDIAD